MNRQQRRATAKRERAGAADARPRAGDSGLKRSLELYQAGQVAEAARKLPWDIFGRKSSRHGSREMPGPSRRVVEDVVAQGRDEARQEPVGQAS